MKLVIAIIQPDKLDDVKEKLFHAEIRKMTVSRVKGCGQQGGFTEHYRGQIRSVNLLEKIKLEIVVNDTFVRPTIDAIIKATKSGNIGDGKIFVMPMEECIRIRTEEEGSEAVG